MRRVQRVVEARSGVLADVTSVVLALHESLVVRYDSGAGLTHGTESWVGNGQGDTLGPTRSMEPLAIETRAIEWLVMGHPFRVPTLRGQGGLPAGQRTRTVSGWFADDGALVVDAFCMLQRAFTVASVMARVLGFTIGIDADADGKVDFEEFADALKNFDVGVVRKVIRHEKKVAGALR